MKKKILLVQTNYPGFLKSFDKETDNLNKLSYRQLRRKWAGECFGQSDFYSKNLQKYGWEGEEVVINSWSLQTKWAEENGVRLGQKDNKWVGVLPESVKNFLGLRGWIKKILLQQIKKLKPRVVYIHDLSVLGVEEIREIKKMGKLVVGQIACPLPLNKKPFYEYDLIVSSFPHYVKMFREWGIDSEYLPWCFEEEIVKKLKKKEKKYEVVFIGGFSPHHSEGNKMLERLANEVKVDFWGYGVETLLPGSLIRKNFHKFVWGEKMYQIMARAKIVVNRHINVAGESANNMRMFEATGVGSLLVTDDKPNMKEFFEPGKEVVIYKEAEDLVEKVKYYLEHNKERERIAKAGQKRTLKNHTYKIRMKELDKILGKYL